MTINTDRDFKVLAGMNVPVKRAAFSDRTAWTMALLAELAYLPFDEESKQQILDLAAELAQINDKIQMAERLTALQKVLAGLNPAPADNADRNMVLKSALAVGGFKLAGGKVLHNVATDTQGFVACRRDKTGTGMAVICFRGTKQIKDWMTNLKIKPAPIKNPQTGTIIGNIHMGFHEAYMSVHDDIANRLKGYEDLPLFITGHSLGGALAVVATWYQSSQRLAACYTFGAPRVGDQGLIDRFKTPIYRIVNGPDPVPFMPPSGFTIDFFKAIIRIIGAVLPFMGLADWVTNKLIKVQRFRHYGNMRYLTVADPGPQGNYPKLRLEFAHSSLLRLTRFVQLHIAGEAKRIDKYHDMSRYRDKLRAYAERRNPP